MKEIKIIKGNMIPSIKNTGILKKIEKNRIIKEMIIIIMILFSGIALSINPAGFHYDLENTGRLSNLIILFTDELRDIDMSQLISVIIAAYFYKKRCFSKGGFSITALVMGFIFSCFILIGKSFWAFNSFEFIIGTKKQFVIASITFLGEWFLFYEILKLLFEKMDELPQYIHIGKEAKGKILNYIDSHFWLCSFLFLVIIWSLQILPFFPGSVPYDGRYQLNCYFGIQNMNTHHPYYATMIMGSIYRLGTLFLGITGGCVFYVTFQLLIGAAVFAYVSSFVRKKLDHFGISVAILFFYAVAPMWWTYIQTIDKDAMYCIMITLFALEYVVIVIGENVSLKDYLLLLVSSIFCNMYRNEARYIILIMAVVLVFLACQKKKAALLSLIIIFITLGLNYYVTGILKLKSDNQVEAMSIPLQQIARTVLRYEEDFSEEDKEAIDGIIEYDGIAERYNPDCSDPVKNYYKNSDSEDWEKFWKVWADKLKQHPKVYIAATVNNFYGYFYPPYRYKKLGIYQLYNKKPFNDNDKGGDYSVYVFGENARDVFTRIAYLWDRFPIMSLILSSGAYTFLFMILFGALARRKRWMELFLFLLPALCLGVCLLSPVNGYIRYVLPIMAIVPIYIVLCINIYLKNYK